jgi:hypothetical protein
VNGAIQQQNRNTGGKKQHSIAPGANLIRCGESQIHVLGFLSTLRTKTARSSLWIREWQQRRSAVYPCFLTRRVKSSVGYYV